MTRWEPRWSLDVARTEDELDDAAVLLAVSLPHLGDRLLVRQHAEGTWWSGPLTHVWLIEVFALVGMLGGSPTWVS